MSQLVFVPLGGIGEIGMNLALYGYGPENNREWIAVDCGVAFAGPEQPGVDLIFPDIRFLESQRHNLKAIIITHAHEDHFGGLLDLWPRLKAPVYATPFTAALLEAKREGEAGAAKVPVNVFSAGDRFKVGPFEIEAVNVTHSIPEPVALAIRTPLGTVVHTGDWKIDLTPALGKPTDEARLRAIGDEGVLALICDSTNAMREGVSPSEQDVNRSLAQIIKAAEGRVALTTFSSNIGRIRSIAEASAEASAMERIRPILDEKVVRATRPSAALMICARLRLTSCSLGETPSRMALVESQIRARTPSSPMARNRASSVGLPSAGVRSIFQSPVWTTVPSGVRIASATGSGMECVTLTASISKGPTLNRSPAEKTFTGTLAAPASPSRLASSNAAVKGVA